MTGKEKPWKQGGNQGYSVNRLTREYRCGYSRYCEITVLIIYQSLSVVQVGLFRASKKTSISGVPASPIADRVPGLGRIKTDYNSCLYTWRSLIDNKFNNLCNNRAISTGYGCV